MRVVYRVTIESPNRDDLPQQSDFDEAVEAFLVEDMTGVETSYTVEDITPDEDRVADAVYPDELHYDPRSRR